MLKKTNRKRNWWKQKNQGEALIHSAEKGVEDAGDKLTEEEKSAVEDAITALKEVIDSDDLSAIQEKSATLSQEAMKIGEKLYQQEQEGNAENNETEASNDDSKEDVVDADYEEVKEDKEEASK